MNKFLKEYFIILLFYKQRHLHCKLFCFCLSGRGKVFLQRGKNNSSGGVDKESATSINSVSCNFIHTSALRTHAGNKEETVGSQILISANFSGRVAPTTNI